MKVAVMLTEKRAPTGHKSGGRIYRQERKVHFLVNPRTRLLFATDPILPAKETPCHNGSSRRFEHPDAHFEHSTRVCQLQRLGRLKFTVPDSEHRRSTVRFWCVKKQGLGFGREPQQARKRGTGDVP